MHKALLQRQAFAMPPTSRRVGGAARAKRDTAEDHDDADANDPLDDYARTKSNAHGRGPPRRQRPVLVSEVDRQGWVVPLADEELPDWDSFDTTASPRHAQSAGGQSVASTTSGVTISASGLHGMASSDASLKTKARIHRSGSVDILIPGPGGEPSPTLASAASHLGGGPVASPARVSVVATRFSPRKSQPASAAGRSRSPATRRSSLGQDHPPAVPRRQQQASLSHGTRAALKSPARQPQHAPEDKTRDLERFFADQQERLDRTLQFERERQLREGYKRSACDDGAAQRTEEKSAPARDRALGEISDEKAAGFGASHARQQRPAPRQLHTALESTMEPRNGAASLADEVSFWELRRRRDYDADEVDVSQIKSLDPASAIVARGGETGGAISQRSRAALGVAWLRHEFEACTKKLFGNDGEDSSWTTAPHMRQLPADLKREQGLYGLWCLLDETVHAWVQRERHLRGINKEGAELSQRALRQAHEARRADKVRLQVDFVNKLEEARKQADEARAREKDQYEARIAELEGKRRAFELKCLELSTEKKQREAAAVQLREEEQRSKHAQETARDRFEADLKSALEKAEKQVAALQEDNLAISSSREVEASTSSQRVRALEAELLRIRDELAIDHEEEMTALRNEHAQRYREIEHKMQQLVSEHERFVRQLQAEHDAKTSAVRKEHNMQLEMARRATANAKKATVQLKERHSEQLRRLHVHQRAKEAAYEKDLQRIRRQASHKRHSWTLPQAPPPPPPSPPPSPPPPPSTESLQGSQITIEPKIQDETGEKHAGQANYTALLDEYIDP